MFWELSRRLGTPIPLLGGEIPLDRKPTDDEVIDLAYANSRMPMDDVRANLGVVHEDLAMIVQPADDGPGAHFAVAPDDLMAELDAVRVSASAMPGDEFPFRLVSRRLKAILNSLGTELSALRKSAGTTNHAYMNPGDMADLDMIDDELVEITSRRSSVIGVAKASPDVRCGVVSMAHSWGAGLNDDKVRDIGTTTSRLVSTSDGFDPVTGMVIQSAIPVRLGKVPEPAVV